MILCCGEALIDMVPASTAQRDAAYQPVPGGAIFNTAVALGRLNAQASLLSGISTDAFGQKLAETLRENHVGTDLLIRSDRLSTLAVVHLSDGQASYSFYDENSAGRMIHPGDLPAIPSDIKALYFGGISLVAEPAADTYAALAQSKGNDHLIMLDPNIRTGFITDERRYRARLAEMIGCSDIVKVSDEDLAWIAGGTGDTGDTGDIEYQARQLITQGPKVVIVTLGSKGAIAFSGSDSITQEAVPTKVADTIGAGDTFNAGLLAALQADGKLDKQTFHEMPLRALGPALARAAKVAAITVSRVGAVPPWAHEL